MSTNDRLSSEFSTLRDRIQAAITDFEAATGVCIVGIRTWNDSDEFRSFTRPKAGKTTVSFIELGA